MAERITTKEAAARLGITERTLWRMRDAGKLHEVERVGRQAYYDAAEVDRLREERLGVAYVERITMAEVYKRLTDADTWGEVRELLHDMAPTICLTAEDKGPLEKSYRAACGMAATHPDEEARRRWREKADTYASWLGLTADETEKAIRYRAQDGTFATYEAARAEAAEAPTDRAYVMACGQCGPMSVNSE